MDDDRLGAYLQAVLDEARRALIEFERRRAQRKVSNLTPQQRREQIRAYNQAGKP
jgi:hypothetical protein